ncbi:MAG TPA: hypothetical protein VKQ36_14665 [Ktedonobacterales bacterium]|nr:hypothetical protein [Ktedonobacterales bacterium]
MEGVMRYATFQEEGTPTLADLCRAIASGRLPSGRHNGQYEVSFADVRRWRRQEAAARRLLTSLGDDLWSEHVD